MNRYEYKVLRTTVDENLESTLNDLGADGWQLVTLQLPDTSSVVIAVFMRPAKKNVAAR